MYRATCNFGIFVAMAILLSAWNTAWGVASIPGVTIATAGFNSDYYQLDANLWGQGEDELGWGTNTWGSWKDNGWAVSTGTVKAIADPAAREGDGDLRLAGIANSQVGAWRYWSVAQTTPFWIEQYVKVTSGSGGFGARVGTGASVSTSAIGWSVANGRFHAQDGNGSGGGPMLDTGFDVTPMEWQKVSLLIDPTTLSYEFYVDDQRFNASTPLHFRSNMASINHLNYLSNQEAWIDGIRVVVVPEPSTIILLLTGAVGFLGCSWRRRRAV